MVAYHGIKEMKKRVVRRMEMYCLKEPNSRGVLVFGRRGGGRLIGTSGMVS